MTETPLNCQISLGSQSLEATRVPPKCSIAEYHKGIIRV